MDLLSTTSFNIPLFIGTIAFLIFIHELGHFIVARLLKIEIEEFGIGFPPRMIKLFRAWDTDFTLNWLPLGGFVRPKGENDPNIPGGLAAANPWARMAVLLAGPIMNLGLAAILFSILFIQIGVADLSKVAILDLAENSPAQEIGLEIGDIITAINDVEINSTNELYESIYALLGQEIKVSVLRNEIPEIYILTPRANPPEGEGAIGIMMGNPRILIETPQALLLGLNAVYQNSIAIIEIPGKIISGTMSPEVGRPVGYKGMYDIYSALREIDSSQTQTNGTNNFSNTIGFFASISVSLGILNLLPIPALDGGRILFVLPEIIFRKRIPQNFENLVNLVSITLLLLLMVYVNLQDFISPINIP